MLNTTQWLREASEMGIWSPRFGISEKEKIADITGETLGG